MRARRFLGPSKQAIGGARGPGAAHIHTLLRRGPNFLDKARPPALPLDRALRLVSVPVALEPLRSAG